MRTTLGLFCGAAIATIFLCTPAMAAGKDDYRIDGNLFKRGEGAQIIRAIEIPDLGKSGGVVDVAAPAIVHLCEVGANAVCTNLPGLNADGSAIDSAAIASLAKLVVRCKDERVAVLVRVLGDNPDPAFRKKAIETAAKALKSEHRVLYVIDGKGAGALAKQFKTLNPGALVAAPKNGDMHLVTGSAQIGPLDIVFHALPPDAEKTHFILAGSKSDYEALDKALTNPAAKKPWTPDNSVLTEQERKDGFIALFNGRDLDGWWQWKADKPAPFKVNAQHELEFAATGAEAIMSRDRYGDFILRAEYKIAAGANSGIFIRAPRDGRQSYIGMEIQIIGDPKSPPSDDMTGAIYKQHAPLLNAVKGPDEWNSEEIECRGSHIKVTLNGKLVQDYDLATHPELKHRLRRGFIGLQDHHDKVSFRNVRIKPL